MMQQRQINNNILTGSLLALGAVIIWSGNFIIAKYFSNAISPIALAFFRWTIATLTLLPFCIRPFIKNIGLIKKQWQYYFFIALSGITIFNTLVYIGTDKTTATNLALLGTTSAPVFTILLSYLFLKEKPGIGHWIGLLFTVAGVLYLITAGKWQNLIQLSFNSGDLWVLASGCSFAIYTLLVKKLNSPLPPPVFLFTIFLTGTLLLLPAYIIDDMHQYRIIWSKSLISSLLYLGIGASVISYYLWNLSIKKMGATKTALFSNLIPLFAGLQAFLLLQEAFTNAQLISMILIFTGIIIANTIGKK